MSWNQQESVDEKQSPNLQYLCVLPELTEARTEVAACEAELFNSASQKDRLVNTVCCWFKEYGYFEVVLEWPGFKFSLTLLL